MPKEIIDSHIHLFTSSDLAHLSWMTPSHPLHASHSIAEYTTASIPDPADPIDVAFITGFIFVETDRSYPLPLQATDECLSQPLAELKFAAGLEGCLGVVPFAPIPLGREGMEKWWAMVEEKEKRRVLGVRYLFQDKPARTMLQEGVMDGIKWALDRGMAFDLGLDFHKGGEWQMIEAVEMLKRVFEGAGSEGGWVVLSDCPFRFAG